ncbi:hypothetical protein RYA05_02955 [Pseudomonas syringae pv. actinidiae]|nr:hypothetical protein [Pseudomonas syringae pv. actinidiae]
MDLKIERSSLRLMYSFGMVSSPVQPILDAEGMKIVIRAKDVLNRAQEIFETSCRSDLPPDFKLALDWPESPVLHVSNSRSESNGLICVAFKCMMGKAIFTREQVRMLHLLANNCVAEACGELGATLEFQGAIVMVDSHAEFTPTDLL